MGWTTIRREDGLEIRYRYVSRGSGRHWFFCVWLSLRYGMAGIRLFGVELRILGRLAAWSLDYDQIELRILASDRWRT